MYYRLDKTQVMALATLLFILSQKYIFVKFCDVVKRCGFSSFGEIYDYAELCNRLCLNIVDIPAMVL